MSLVPVRRFNPRPAFQPGETFVRAYGPRRSTCFNLRPAFQPGETLRRIQQVQNTLFQSAPGFSAGRDASLRDGDPVLNVSICARLFSRARQQSIRLGALDRSFQSAPGFSAGRDTYTSDPSSCKHSFNLRPAFQPGETAGECRGHVHHAVSICARLFSRARRTSARDAECEGQVSICARLFSRARRPEVPVGVVDDGFQSAPGFSAGRDASIANY